MINQYSYLLKYLCWKLFEDKKYYNFEWSYQFEQSINKTDMKKKITYV